MTNPPKATHVAKRSIWLPLNRQRYDESEIAEPVGTGFALTDHVKQRRWVYNRNRPRNEARDYIGFFFDTGRDLGSRPSPPRMNDAHMSSDPSALPVASG